MTTPVAPPARRSGGGPPVRLIGVDEAPLLLRQLFASGDPGPIAAALAQVPELCQATLPFIDAALGPSWVPARLKEIAVLRTSALLGCRYCVDAHTVVAHEAGFDLDQVAGLRCEAPVEPALADPVELAVLRWVDQVAGGAGPIDGAAAGQLAQHLPDHAIVELTVTVGATMFLNRFATALRLPTSPETAARLAALGLAGWQPPTGSPRRAAVRPGERPAGSEA
jgi:AhpD family alkylhydroperoxidase